MAKQVKALRVSLSPDGFYPQAFLWRGRPVRVLSVEGVRTFRRERRYRVRTGEGYFELGFCTDTGAWFVGRSPNWFSRAWAQWQSGPSYPLPAWRRRSRRTLTARTLMSVPVERGGNHAERLALVRQ